MELHLLIHLYLICVLGIYFAGFNDFRLNILVFFSEMSVPRWHIGTGTFEDCYLSFHTYVSACIMHSCVIYLSRHHNFESRHAQNPIKRCVNVPVPMSQQGTLI